MKKMIFTLFLLVVGFGAMVAQRTISGTITDEEGLPLIGASVLIKGTSNGTVTDVNGYYEVQVPSDKNVLTISYTGFVSKELVLSNNQTTYNLELALDSELLDEVVVTGLGISREEKSLGYTVQKLEGDKLTISQESNVLNAMAGKVSGVQVLSGASSSVGGSSKVRIRGVNGLTGGDPLYVVDGTPLANNNFSSSTDGPDYGNLASDINPDDIAEMTVLKGPAATAIYGERGKYGVVLITTKKGSNKKGLGVTLKSSYSLDKVYILPEYQNEYAGGYSQNLINVVDPKDGQTYKRLNYSADESWGPKMDGTLYRPWYSWYDDENYGKTIPLAANPDNVRNFFENGHTNTNGVEIAGASDNASIRLGFTNLNQKGVIPNSSFIKNSVNVAANYDVNEHLSAQINVTLLSQGATGRTSFGYSPIFGNPINSFNQWFQRQLSIEELENYKNADGTFRSWNIRSPFDPRPLYWDSPYVSVYENAPTDSRNRYFGNVGLTYKVNDNLSFKGTFHRDNFNQLIEQKIVTGGLELDYYSNFKAVGTEDNYELIGLYQNKFGEISLDVTAGGNLRKNKYVSTSGSTNGGLTSPNLFTLGASVDRPTLSTFLSRKDVQSLFGSATLGFKNTYYFGATLRNDWSSTLPVDNNSYLYSSVNGAIVFSEFINSDVLSLGKIRGSVAQVGSDLSPYQVAFTYGLGTPYGSLPNFGVPDQLVNTNLKPAITTSFEAGLDLAFFQNKLGLDFTYYVNNNKDEILAVQVPGASGFSTALINAGHIQSKGVELGLSATPYTSKNFAWNTRINFGKNTTTVLDLYEDLKNYKLADGIGAARWGGLTLNAFVGDEWGLMRGNGYTYLEGHEGDENFIIIDPESGYYELEANKDLGSILPDFTGGFLNSFNIFGFNLGINIDFQKGGLFHSVTKMFNNYSGLGIETVGKNDRGNDIRNPLTAADGSPFDGTFIAQSAAGSNTGGFLLKGVSPEGQPVIGYRDTQDFYEGEGFGFHERNTYDASYIKIRDISLGYTFGKDKLQNSAFEKLQVSIVAKNPWLMYSKIKGFDPSEILPGSNNLAFEERAQLPSVRSVGVNLVVGF